ncbi:MAG: ATP synthase F1 subunit epsilon [Spirochaetaceae bacterium]|jgi:F-type H+-transporting ATPase subunit epsilon|nr:ATP synthase F1 subunit epsilon [Spirochaetaceae bacterium]
MPAALFNLEIHTPHRLFFIDKVEAIILTLEDGEAGIYANHSFMIAPIKTCILRIRDKDGLRKDAFITEGILEVSGHRTVLLVDAAEWPDEIDPDRALAAKNRAEEELKESVMKFETENAQVNLKRAETRLKAYELREKARPD